MKYSIFSLLLLIAACTSSKVPTTTEQSGVIFTNPLFTSGADPWITFVEGAYYYCYSRGGALHVKTAKNILDLRTAEAMQIWQPPADTKYSKELWAPELHKIEGRWYVYFAADDGDNANHRMYVLGSKDGSIGSGFEFLGQVGDASDKWAIDGTVFTHGGKSYFMWSGWKGDVNEAQHLYIAEMASPTEISSERVLVSSPDQDWEQRGSGNGLPTINEGPQVLKKNGRLYIVYSASGSWSNFYCLGLLRLDGVDPMDPAAWTKHPEPVFEGTDCVLSPGHCSFTTIGDQDWIVYHVTGFPGGGWNSRYVKMQPFYWNEAGPLFGKPVEDGVLLEIR
ncbi:glycoside hydrolase family 43 protein [Flavilitoribacter nigricans]|uniref:Glycosyl hydrolase family 43 n=1 Tax=Flavilitoribacter nigricans (strain ATCC 23147 / DSM 23189 / NBRC 102662 / NCIMB 1420 / SS-2) TaxID=1122177 RepID=A0A2D0NEM7_FLAN2|nr:glycoside hydrolase family 43 protein [Flavilitoribacter nigricans]PHN06927.1 glycosyl hydrolase family 43 [Flavilitoribacter nigricans DSM 23189 = NBRC 102662]